MKRKLKGTEGLYIESKNRSMDVNLLDQVRIKVQIGPLSGIPTDSTGQTTIDSTSSDFVVGLQFNESWITAATQAGSTTTDAMASTLYAAIDRGSVVFDTNTKKLVTFSSTWFDSNGDPTEDESQIADMRFTVESFEYPTEGGVYVGTAQERDADDIDVVFTCKVEPAMPPLSPNPTISLTYLTSEKAASVISTTADSFGPGPLGGITDSENFFLLPNYTYGKVYYRTKVVNIAWSAEMSIFPASDRKSLAYHGYFKAAVNYNQAQPSQTGTITTTVSLPSDVSYRSSTAPTFSDGHIYRWDIEDGKIWFTDLGTTW